MSEMKREVLFDSAEASHSAVDTFIDHHHELRNDTAATMCVCDTCSKVLSLVTLLLVIEKINDHGHSDTIPAPVQAFLNALAAMGVQAHAVPIQVPGRPNGGHFNGHESHHH